MEQREYFFLKAEGVLYLYKKLKKNYSNSGHFNLQKVTALVFPFFFTNALIDHISNRLSNESINK